MYQIGCTVLIGLKMLNDSVQLKTYIYVWAEIHRIYSFNLVNFHVTFKLLLTSSYQDALHRPGVFRPRWQLHGDYSVCLFIISKHTDKRTSPPQRRWYLIFKELRLRFLINFRAISLS